ncbi:hypothetical protein MTsN4n12_30980 [Microbacterium sp. MTN4-12]
MLISRPFSLGAIVAAAALMLTSCAGSSSQSSADGEAELTSIAVGMTPIANAAPVYLAIQEGFFEDEGLKVTPTTIQAAAAAIPSLINDELQFALVSAVPTITAASKGLPVRVVAANDHYNPDATATDAAALVASAGSGITDMADLGGATVAVVGLKSAPELATRVALEKVGVDPSTVDFVEISYPDMVPALQSDRVDAAVVVDPFLSQVKEAGLSVIGQPFLDGLAGEVGTTWIAADAFVSQNADTAAGFVRAIEKAVAYAAENPDAVREIMGTYTETDPEVLAKSLLPVFDSSISSGDLQYYADTMLDQGFIAESYDASELLWQR